MIKDALSGLTYKSNSPLTSQELLGIASEAKSMTYLEGEVNWLMAALKQAKFEKLSAKAISSIKLVNNYLKRYALVIFMKFFKMYF